MMKMDFTYSMKTIAFMTRLATISIKTALMQWAANMIKRDTILSQRKKISEALVMMISKITI